MEANQDREWHVSPFLYPVERDSKVTVPNPDYHPSVFYREGKFWGDPACLTALPMSRVPRYIRNDVQVDLPPPRVMPHITVTADPDVYARNGGAVGPDTLLRALAVANAEHDKPEPAAKRGRGRPPGSKNKTKPKE